MSHVAFLKNRMAEEIFFNGAPSANQLMELSLRSQQFHSSRPSRRPIDDKSAATPADKPAAKSSAERTKEDILAFPGKLFATFNEGDLVRLVNLIDEACTEDCILKTPFSTENYTGRNFVKRLFQSIAMTHPDIVFKLKDFPKVINEKDGSLAIAVTVYFSGTRTGTLPAFTDEIFRRPGENLAQTLLNTSKMSTVEAAAALKVGEKNMLHGAPYKASGKMWFRISVNEHFQATEWLASARISSLQEAPITTHINTPAGTGTVEPPVPVSRPSCSSLSSDDASLNSSRSDPASVDESQANETTVSGSGNGSGSLPPRRRSMSTSTLEGSPRSYSRFEESAKLQEALQFGVKLYDAYNAGDVDEVTKVIENMCIENCALRTQACEEGLVGREYVLKVYVLGLKDFPDVVNILKGAPKLTILDDGTKQVEFKTVFSGTRTNKTQNYSDSVFFKPGDSFTDQIQQGSLTKKPDGVSVSKNFLENSQVTSLSYKARGTSTIKLTLNEEFKVCEFYIGVKFSSLQDAPPGNEPGLEEKDSIVVEEGQIPETAAAAAAARQRALLLPPVSPRQPPPSPATRVLAPEPLSLPLPVPVPLSLPLTLPLSLSLSPLNPKEDNMLHLLAEEALKQSTTAASSSSSSSSSSTPPSLSPLTANTVLTPNYNAVSALPLDFHNHPSFRPQQLPVTYPFYFPFLMHQQPEAFQALQQSDPQLFLSGAGGFGAFHPTTAADMGMEMSLSMGMGMPMPMTAAINSNNNHHLPMVAVRPGSSKASSSTHSKAKGNGNGNGKGNKPHQHQASSSSSLGSVSTDAADGSGTVSPDDVASYHLLSPQHVEDSSLLRILQFPGKLFTAFNEGNLDRVCSLIDDTCTDDCVLRTPFVQNTYPSKHYVKHMFMSFARTHPDSKYTLKDFPRIINEADGSQAVAVTVYYSGTRMSTEVSFTDEIFRRPGANVADSIVDTSKMAPEEVAQAREVGRRNKLYGDPYHVEGKMWFRLSISDGFGQKRICEWLSSAKMTKLRSVPNPNDTDSSSRAQGAYGSASSPPPSPPSSPPSSPSSTASSASSYSASHHHKRKRAHPFDDRDIFANVTRMRVGELVHNRQFVNFQSSATEIANPISSFTSL